MSLVLSCASNRANKAQTGIVLGSGVGALAGQAIGHNTKGTLIGLAIGAFLGYTVGNEMDKQDALKIEQVYEKIPDGRTAKWNNPNNGNDYKVTPLQTYKQGGKNCREAEVLVTINGRPKKMIQTACRDSNGRWVAQ